jgi:hypothetical protein
VNGGNIAGFLKVLKLPEGFLKVANAKLDQGLV